VAKHGDGTGLIQLDPWLKPYSDHLRRRYQRYVALRRRIEASEGSLERFATGHAYFGLNRGTRDGNPGIWCREWAPGAHALSLIGDFNGWDRNRHPMARDEYGVWSIFLPDGGDADNLLHESRVKVHVQSASGTMDRIPAYIRRSLYEPETRSYVGQFWDPSEPYNWHHSSPRLTSGLRIYEAHVGIASEEPKVGTYAEFAENVLPRIAAGGYNAVQLMAIQEHPYYGSFGYHVSNFFAPSSRFGTPEELKAMIDTAHGMGLLVLLDVVHSHSVKNLHDGLNAFDGTGHQYFHAAPRGDHPDWDSRLFDYSKWEVLRFLLSNTRFWLEEYRFDGFRFDGVTSMMYLHHGNKPFTSYDDYLIHDIDEDAVSYLQLANALAHTVRSDVISIAEDHSGMVGLARPVDEGGLGFDYRLAMGLPDNWIKLLKHARDEDWDMGELYYTLTNRRFGEKHIAYAESHDQALVGDKTLAFRLMDADMYWHMNRASENLVIDRGIALHKMIRLITFALGGEAYLNFMRNEFGHPEWIDFPREGNNWSHKYARRQWSLVDHPDLRYRDLAAFDRAMLSLDEQYDLLNQTVCKQINVDNNQQVIVFSRGPIVIAMNFHANASYTDYRFGVDRTGHYEVVLDTDDRTFGGHGLTAPAQRYPVQKTPSHARPQSIQIYIPARSAQVLVPIDTASGHTVG